MPLRPAVTTAAMRFEVTGTVQGVGFRPFVHRLATGLRLDGWVRNEGGRVTVLAAGPPSTLLEFLGRLEAEAPPLARITGISGTPVPGFTGERGFTVLPSADRADCAAQGRLIPPDTATCPACLHELFDPADRRFRYPFLNCTDCGPRATIIDDLPYDRQRTAMARFPLCALCAAEYADPGDRRFHAEPVACPVCGPELDWEGRFLGEAALQQAEDAVRDGAIIAVKGLGGYQLVCDAADSAAVERLRTRKHRPAKPLAVMVADLAAADAHAQRLGPDERRLLASPARPIVLVDARPGTLPTGIHPGTRRVGLFLPATPLHHLLLRDLDRPLVVTSGNFADEPIAIDDLQARRRLDGVADGWLTHNRPILARYDDSVAQIPRAGAPALLRRARGYAPTPLRLPIAAPQPVLAVGAQLKHTFTVAVGDRAHLGPHTGDLADADTLAAYEAALERLLRIQRLDRPDWVAHDLHPGYLSSAQAGHWPAARRIPVQHHHAHLASCAAEHGLTGSFLGVAFDGLGLGDDGTLWGGELLYADLAGYRRLGRFARAPLPGGEAAVRHPARMALGYLHGLEPLGGPVLDPRKASALAARLGRREHDTVVRMIERGVNSPQASSAGRLFDAVAALLGLGDQVSYEGQAAVALEQAAGDLPAEALPWRLATAGGLRVYDPAPTLAAVLERAEAGEPPGPVAAAFHTTLAEVTAAMVAEAVVETGATTVCLSGGCFQNRRLLNETADTLETQGLRVLWNQAVPANDGGISYGQAAVAAARLAGDPRTAKGE